MSDDNESAVSEGGGGGSTMVRQIVLIGILVLVALGWYYEFKIARPAHQAAFNAITERDPNEGPATAAEIEAITKKKPVKTEPIGDYDVSTYRWTSLVPNRKYEFHVAYLNDKFFGLYETDSDVQEHLNRTATGVEGPDDAQDAGGGGGGGGGRGNRNRDPAEMFGGMDTDGDGRISSEEAAERGGFAERLMSWDKDGDGVSLEELQAGFAERRAQRGDEGGPRGGRPDRPQSDDSDDDEEFPPYTGTEEDSAIDAEIEGRVFPDRAPQQDQ